MITGTAFVDPSAAYNTLNHKNLNLETLEHKIAHNVDLSHRTCCQIEDSMLDEETWIAKMYCYLPGSFNLYTNDKPEASSTQTTGASQPCTLPSHTIEEALGEFNRVITEITVCVSILTRFK